MSNRRELQTPLTVFEPGEDKGLEFLTSFLGPENLHTVLQILVDEQNTVHVPLNGSAEAVNHVYASQLQEYFPSLSAELLQSELLRREHLVKANNTVNSLRRTAFPHAELQLDLLNPIYYTTSSVPKRLVRLLANGSISARFKFELLRQEVLMLTSLAYAESRFDERTVENLNDINDLFENELYTGKYGEGFPYSFFSVHDNQTNEAYIVSDDFTSIPAINYATEHYKQHTQLVRQIEGVGPVLVRQREKSTESALVKAIYKGSQLEGEYIDISQITDPSGFMFVTKDRKNTELYSYLEELITKHYPSAQIEEDHHVNTNRNQSSSVSFLRMQVYLSPEAKYPIEIIIFTQAEYLNYRYHLGTQQDDPKSPFPDAAAHTLYELRRSYAVADMLFPQELYDYDVDETWQKRRMDQEHKAQDLLEHNRVVIPAVRQ